MSQPGTFVVDPPSRPARNAEHYLQAVHSHPERWTLLYHRREFYVWTGAHWHAVDRDTLRSDVYQMFKDAAYWNTSANGPSTLERFDVSKTILDGLMDALQNEILIDRDVDTPALLDGNESARPNGLHPRDMLACRNGILYLPRRELWAHTPRLFNHMSVAHDYDRNAPYPNEWIDFLDSLWPHNPQAVATLQEWFGYCLTSQTDFQKMLMLYGPKRAGKGTILHVLTMLLGGERSVTVTSLASLNHQFGIAHLEDKQLAIMSDVRFRSRDDGIAVERLLSITGEDEVLIDRKHVQAYSAHIPTRIMLASNELPKMADESGALVSRMILLKLVETFIDREDKTLRIRLTDRRVMSGILNWALDGLDRLRDRGYFVQPDDAAEDLSVISDMSSPTQSFVDECCVIGGDHLVSRDRLYDVLSAWCAKTGTYRPNRATFGRNIRAAVPRLETVRLGERSEQTRYYRGIGLNETGAGLIALPLWDGKADHTQSDFET